MYKKKHMWFNQIYLSLMYEPRGKKEEKENDNSIELIIISRRKESLPFSLSYHKRKDTCVQT